MDSSTFTILIAVIGLAAGFGLCWLLMRGRSAAPAPQSQLQPEELLQAKERIRKLEEERQLAIKNYEDLKHETARARGVANVIKKDSAAPAEQGAQVAALQAELATLQAQEQATRADAAKAKAAALAEQTQAKDYFRSLEKNQQAALASTQALKLEGDQLREALEVARQEQARAAQHAAQVPALQARLAALENQDASNQQAALRKTAPQAAESAEALKRTQARVLALEQENATLKRNAAAMPAANPAAAPGQQATQLPVLEEQVMALQKLEKAIKKEFELLSELQRNVTLTSATRHEFSDSPESRTGSATAA